MKNMMKFAEHIIAIANKNNKFIINLQLQKIMYFTMKNTKVDLDFLINLYDEPFEVWRYGPTVRVVYDKFKRFVTSPIISSNAKTHREYDIFDKEIVKLLDEDFWDLIELCQKEDFYQENKKHIFLSTSNVTYPLEKVIQKNK